MKTRFDPFVLFIAILFAGGGVFTGQGLAAPSTLAAALGTQFVYEGRIGTFTGTYDLQLRLWNAATGGALVGSPSTVLANDVRLNQGQYQVFLNFGPAAFTGQALFVEVGYRPGTSTGAYTIQPQRQPILPVAYALSLRPGAVIGGSQTGASLRVNNEGEGVGVWGNGNNDPGVYGTSNTSNGVSGVSNGTNPAAGVYGQSTAGRGVWGKSSTGVGVFGQSSSQAGVSGESSGFDGGFFRSLKNTAAGVSGHNDAGGMGVYGRSANGTGVVGSSTTGAAFRADGNARQLADKGGWVKAMAVVEDGTIVRCYNGVTGASTNGCGFSAGTAGKDEGTYSWINFGFPVDQRFITADFISDSGSDHTKVFYLRNVVGSTVTMQNWSGGDCTPFCSFYSALRYHIIVY